MENTIDRYILKSHSFVSLLTKEESKIIKEKLVKKEIKKGISLFHQNSYSKGIFIIIRGRVKIYQTNSSGKQSIVYIYKKGDYFGYRPILADEPNPVAAKAMENTLFYFLPSKDFIEVLENSKTLAKKLLINLSKETSVWIRKLTTFSQLDVKKRLALSLLILHTIYNKPGNNLKGSFFSINRQDLACYVGTAKETLVRMLKTYKIEGIIETSGAKITILKPNELLAIAGEFV